MGVFERIHPGIANAIEYYKALGWFLNEADRSAERCLREGKDCDKALSDLTVLSFIVKMGRERIPSPTFFEELSKVVEKVKADVELAVVRK